MTNHPNRSKWAIWCEPGYYLSDLYGRDQPGNVIADCGVGATYIRRGQTLAFARRADADTVAKMLNDYGNQPYRLDCGQHSAPVYMVRRYRGKEHAVTVQAAMLALDLEHDFREDGSRIPV